MSSRLRLFDALRGASVVSMVLFHYCYDLKFIVGTALPWFAPPLQDIWRASISWTFLFVAGCMCALSHDNLKRALSYGIVALAICLVTAFAAVDDPISFGIMYCMFACTLTEWILERLRCSPRGPWAAGVLFALFLMFFNISRGYIQIGPSTFFIPRLPYDAGIFSWLGFPGPGFVSGDYYPLLPYLFVYLAGSSMGWWLKQRGFPQAFYHMGCKPLELVGCHALLVYIIHQPILLLICGISWW